MTVTTKLGDILDIPAGTLIKGLHVSYSGSIRFSLHGWNIEQRRYIKGLWTSVDREVFTFEYYPDARVADLFAEKTLYVYKPGNMTFETFRRNGEAYYKDINHWVKQEQFVVGDCIGMSLGESFVAIQPTNAEMYRPDYYEIYLFHKILHNDTIKWIILRSNALNKKRVILNPQVLLLDIDMELL